MVMHQTKSGQYLQTVGQKVQVRSRLLSRYLHKGMRIQIISDCIVPEIQQHDSDVPRVREGFHIGYCICNGPNDV